MTIISSRAPLGRVRAVSKALIDFTKNFGAGVVVFLTYDLVLKYSILTTGMEGPLRCFLTEKCISSFLLRPVRYLPLLFLATLPDLP